LFLISLLCSFVCLNTIILLASTAFSMLRRLARAVGAAAQSASISSAAERSGLIAAACILERLPLVMPPPPVWETEYQACAFILARVLSLSHSLQAWREKKQAGTYKTYPKARRLTL